MKPQALGLQHSLKSDWELQLALQLAAYEKVNLTKQSRCQTMATEVRNRLPAQ